MNYENIPGIPPMPDFEAETKKHLNESAKQLRFWMIPMRIICIGLILFIMYFSQHGWSMSAPGAPWHNNARGTIGVDTALFVFVWILGEIALYVYGRNKS